MAAEDEMIASGIAATMCIFGAATAAGLTMGLMSLDPMALAIKLTCGDEAERGRARRLLPLVQKHHLLLVTLLLFNALANEALPVFLEDLVPTWASILLSITLVLIFGEILPSAIFTGPNQLAIASALAPLTWLLITVLWPVAYPISWLLDRLLGHEGVNTFSRNELSMLVSLHDSSLNMQQDSGNLDVQELEEIRLLREASAGVELPVQRGLSGKALADNQPSQPGSSLLSNEEVLIVQSVLGLHTRTVMDVMIPIGRVFVLDLDQRLTRDVLADLLWAGHSRVPVVAGNPANVRGMVLVKKLIVVDSADERELSTIPLRTPLCVSPSISVLSLLNSFQAGNSHLALVTHDPAMALDLIEAGRNLAGTPAAPLGIVTLEDVLETLVGKQILDEKDVAKERRGMSVVKKAVRRLRRRARTALRRPSSGAVVAAAAAAAIRGRISASESTVSAGIPPDVLLSSSPSSPTSPRSRARAPAPGELVGEDALAPLRRKGAVPSVLARYSRSLRTRADSLPDVSPAQSAELQAPDGDEEEGAMAQGAAMTPPPATAPLLAGSPVSTGPLERRANRPVPPARTYSKVGYGSVDSER